MSSVLSVFNTLKTYLMDGVFATDASASSPEVIDLTVLPEQDTPGDNNTENEQGEVTVKEEPADEPAQTAQPPRKRGKGEPKRRTASKRVNTIPLVCFNRLVKEIAQDNHNGEYIWSSDALRALQECTEEYMEQRFRVCGRLSELCKRNTLNKEVFDFTNTYLYQPVPQGFHE
jgi:histone H3/H4